MSNIKLYTTLCVLCSLGVNILCQNVYHYEISSERRSTGFVNVEYGSPTNSNTDVVELFVYSESGPCKNCAVTISIAGNSLTGETDSSGSLYLDRNWYWPWGAHVFNIKIQPPNHFGETRVLPIEQRIEFWGMKENNEVPIRITVYLEPKNIYIIHIRSRKPLDNVRIEKIRNRIYRDIYRRPRIKGIEYEVVSYL